MTNDQEKELIRLHEAGRSSQEIAVITGLPRRSTARKSRVGKLPAPSPCPRLDHAGSRIAPLGVALSSSIVAKNVLDGTLSLK